jgi:cell division protein FtsI/penicillin-binding protein 2
VVVVLAFAIGAVLGSQGGSSAANARVLNFVRAWKRGDWAAMYADIDRRAQRSISAGEFAGDYEAAASTATVTEVVPDIHFHDESSGLVVVRMHVHTALFGTITADLRVPVRSEDSDARIAWSSDLLFPGLQAGEHLERHTSLPARAAILARDGSVLAEGTPAPGSAGGERYSPLGSAATAVVGKVGPIPSSERSKLGAEGVPTNAVVGTSGLEQAFETRLRGTPGGQLLEGQRVIATATAKPAPPLKTSISPAIQRAAVLALGSQFGGVVVMRPRTGEVLAVAGIGIDDTQPPGSTFKMVTLPAVLEAGVANPNTNFPDATSATLDGVQLRNSKGESCGGSLEEAFAVSCNSVFAPLGAKLGAKRLVAMAERFGFNHSAGLPGALESTLPPASQIRGELAIGSTAIGQDMVLSTPLEMGVVAATVADGGHRPQPTFLDRPPGAAHAGPRVISPSTARTERSFMLAVVRYGTGTSAAIPGVEVAGKTGTAELGGTTCSAGSGAETEGAAEAPTSQSERESCATAEHNNTDAWFAAFAPAQHPTVVVSVMLVRDGFGGESAAPVARQVLEAALESEVH